MGECGADNDAILRLNPVLQQPRLYPCRNARQLDLSTKGFGGAAAWQSPEVFPSMIGAHDLLEPGPAITTT